MESRDLNKYLHTCVHWDTIHNSQKEEATLMSILMDEEIKCGIYVKWITVVLSVAKSCPSLCDPMDCSTSGFLVLPSPRVCSNSCPLSQWCHPAISSSDTLFSCHQSFPASGPFPMSWLFTSGSQNIGASASASVLAMNIQSWFPLELTGLISLLSKGLSRVFSRTTVQNHQFFGAQWIDDFSIVVLWFPSLSLLCSSWRFLLCDFHKACIKYHITIYFMLMTATYSLGLLFNCFNYFLFSYFRSTSDKVMFS